MFKVVELIAKVVIDGQVRKAKLAVLWVMECKVKITACGPISKVKLALLRVKGVSRKSRLEV